MAVRSLTNTIEGPSGENDGRASSAGLFVSRRWLAPSAFIADLPYVVAVIRLAEGVQMLSNIVECDPASLRCEQPVEVVFVPLDDEFTLPKFRPVPDARTAAERGA